MECSVLKYRLFSKHKIHLGGPWCHSQMERQSSSKAAKAEVQAKGTRTASWDRNAIWTAGLLVVTEK